MRQWYVMGDTEWLHCGYYTLRRLALHPLEQYDIIYVMSESKNYHPHTPPHKTFGKYLKTMRQRLQESLGETSGAVEIEVEQLDRFERGAELPSEDILMLLISHFGLQDDEAVELWEMAGYDRETGFSTQDSRNHDHGHEEGQARQGIPVMLLAIDNRVMYTNGVEIVADDSGMVLNFMQNGNEKDQRYPVSRIGMSHEQAEQMLQLLQRAILDKKYMSGPKQLPPQAG